MVCGEVGVECCLLGGDVGVCVLVWVLGVLVVLFDCSCGDYVLDQFVLIVEVDCIGCIKCIQVCLVDVIVGGVKYMYIVIVDLCIGCGLCLLLCLVDCIVLLFCGNGFMLQCGVLFCWVMVMWLLL